MRIKSFGWQIVVGLAIALPMCAFVIESTAYGWSWTASPPSKRVAQPVDDLPSAQICNDALSVWNVSKESEPKSVCLKQAGAFRFGQYYDGGRLQYVVGFGADTNLYKVSLPICEVATYCLYIPEADMLVSKEYIVTPYVRSMAVYKNFSTRLNKIDQGPLLGIKYDANVTSSDFILQSAGGYAWPVEGMSASQNGRWLAVELRERGILRIDTSTLERKRVSAKKYSYGMGILQTVEPAISNDGDNMVLVGDNSGFVMYSGLNNCGDDGTDQQLEFTIPMTSGSLCQEVSIDPNLFINNFHHAVSPSFSPDSSELRLYASSTSGSKNYAVISASNFSVAQMDYLALGDSFSSGEGEDSDGNYLPYTNTATEKCHLSGRSYPFLLADQLGLSVTGYTSVACSGATSGDIVLATSDPYKGQGGRLGNLSESARSLSQQTAMDEFIPGRLAQVEFVSKYNPKAITVGVGGNDVGLMDKLRSCLSNGVCMWAGDPVKREQTATEIKGLYPKLVSLYNNLLKSSPGSYIYAVGYPQVISATGQCDSLLGSLLASEERTYMREAISYMNEVIEAAALGAGIGYIDIENAYGEGVLCGSDKDSLMNGLAWGDDIAPIDFLKDFKALGNESFHPKPAAHKIVADLIYGLRPNMTSQAFCANSKNYCPSSSPAPAYGAYWTQGSSGAPAAKTVSDNRMIKSTDFTDFEREIDLSSGTFLPSSTVDVSIYSNKVDLGSFTANSNGSFSNKFEIPKDIGFGYHTVFVSGISPSSELVEYYQLILLLPPDVSPPAGSISTPSVNNVSPIASGVTNPTNSEVTASAQSGMKSGGEVLGVSIDKPNATVSNVTAEKDISGNNDSGMGTLEFIGWVVAEVIVVLGLGRAIEKFRARIN